LEFLSQHYGVPTVELSTCSIDVQLRELFPLELVQQHLVVPIKKTVTRLTLAMVDPTNSSLLDELRFRTGLHITPMVATESDIRRTIGQAYDLPQNGLSSKNGVEPEYGMVDQQAREAEKQSLSSPATFIGV
jgi:type IV pilus assembly protein PilB